MAQALFTQAMQAQVEACLIDLTGKRLRDVWRLLWTTFGGPPGVGEETRRMAWRGMQALVWHPAFPADLGYDAIYVAPEDLPQTAHWTLNCLKNPDLGVPARLRPEARMTRRPEWTGRIVPPPTPPGHTYIGSGRHRSAYRRGQVVVKIPHGYGGIEDNATEARVYRLIRSGPIRYARCRLLPNGWLVMVYVEPVPFHECPIWADFIDCRQVGTTAQGEVVAYDYGRH